jgi:hypothetical protein
MDLKTYRIEPTQPIEPIAYEFLFFVISISVCGTADEEGILTDEELNWFLPILS